jgi:hypothetical protein
MFRYAVLVGARAGGITLALITGALVFALLGGIASEALAGNGDPVRAGVKNTASKITTLIGKVPGGPALLVKNSRGGVAVEMQTKPGVPPMAVNSSTVVSSLNADLLDGKNASEFMPGSLVRRESAIGAGSNLGDGTFAITQGCNAGETLLSGGPANVNPTSVMVESFPDNSGGWKVRIHKNGGADNFSVVALCAR